MGQIEVEIEDRDAALTLAPLSDRNAVQDVSGILARVSTADDAVIMAGLAFFPRHEPHIQGLELIKGDQRYERATGAGSLSVRRLEGDRLGIALQMLKYGERERATLHGATWDELDRVAGLNLKAYIHGLGAEKFGTGGTLFGSSGKTKNAPAFTVPSAKAEVLLVAWAATRVIPLMLRYGQSLPQGALD